MWCCSKSAAIWGTAAVALTHSGRQPMTQRRSRIQFSMNYTPRQSGRQLGFRLRGKRPLSGSFYETRFTPDGCHVPSPGGKIEGASVFGQ
jgi:hypothetical protein